MNGRLHRATKIMLIRHAEKPLISQSHGVTAEGNPDKESLSIRGWQRAGALAAFFAPANDIFQHPAIATPQFLFASKPVRHHGSLRPVETITPLAEKLGLDINSNFMKFEAEQMMESALARPGVVLICWQHEYLPKIARLISGDEQAPPHWSAHRFDEVWIFDKIETSNSCHYQRVTQNLLARDAGYISDLFG